MTYSLGASGSVDQVKDTLLLQARQYGDKVAAHVTNFLHALLAEVDTATHVSVTAGGVHDEAGYRGQFSITPVQSPSDSPGSSAGG